MFFKKIELQQIVHDLLFLEDDFGKLRNAAEKYYSFFSQITQISDDSTNPEDDTEIFLNEGKAISPKDAARCVLDFARTVKFLRGINATIIESQKRFPNERIEILYAGCGPFATLAIPACTQFKDSDINFSLIDIHQRSLDSAKQIFQKLELETYVTQFIKADAIIYKPDDNKKFHIIITETMQKALGREPQVAVTLNLTNHLVEDGFFVPHEITIEVFLAKMSKEFSFNTESVPKRERTYLGRIFELSAKTASKKKQLLKPKTIKIPKGNWKNMTFLLSTKIIVSDGFLIEDYDSGITCCESLSDFPELQKNQQFEFRYILGENPHFEYNQV